MGVRWAPEEAHVILSEVGALVLSKLHAATHRMALLFPIQLPE